MYGYRRKFDLPYDEVVNSVKRELNNLGFGILTEVDVSATLKEKLDVDIDRYVILGACNPASAYRALQSESDIGLMLPCNVIVYEKRASTVACAIRPTVAMQMIDNPELRDVANEVEAALKKVIDSI